MAELAGRVITAALVVIPGPDGTVTFVRQERGPYAGWWLLPGRPTGWPASRSP
jgi:ADP-ribose pyrophosphatase YjhB (NUDIX family)